MVKILTNEPSSPSSRLTFWVGLAGMGIGVAVGFGAGVNPFYVGLVLGALSAVVYFFTKFEQAVMGSIDSCGLLWTFSPQASLQGHLSRYLLLLVLGLKPWFCFM